MGRVEDALDRTWSDAAATSAASRPASIRAASASTRETIAALDPLFQWVLARRARRRLRRARRRPARAGLVLGNLSFPTSSMSRYAESVWLDAQGARYAGGHAAARAGVTEPARAQPLHRRGCRRTSRRARSGWTAGAFALDAACASSLYAIKLACDRLHDGSADLMLAGAVNRADDLFIHVGFCALAALSRTGRSRPVPPRRRRPGARRGRRLRRARAARGRAWPRASRILGVIRGVGLSNDGRGRGLLAPSEDGQERAMRMALRTAPGSRPPTSALVECHATGTPVGDATEIRSMARVFAGLRATCRSAR